MLSHFAIRLSDSMPLAFGHNAINPGGWGQSTQDSQNLFVHSFTKLNLTNVYATYEKPKHRVEQTDQSQLILGFLSLTAKAHSTQRETVRRRTVPEFFDWLHFTLHTSHFTAWPPVAHRALAGGEGGWGVRGPTARIARDGLMIVE
jgi:hypothetical protein